MAKPENRLVEQAKAGSADAFGQLYAQYAQDLYRFAYYYLGSREEAEDAVQDAVCAAFQGVGALRSAASFKAWLFSILANTCKHHIAAVKERRLTPPARGGAPSGGKRMLRGARARHGAAGGNLCAQR